LLNKLAVRKILVLHWWEADSKSNWFPWLKTTLEKEKIEVIIPNLPEAHAPILNDWLNTAKTKAWKLSIWDTIIWHSMWAKALMHFIQNNNISWINCILVWPTYETIEDEVDLEDPIEIKKKLRDFHETKLDFQKINSLNNQYIVYLSYNDPFINPNSAKKYYSQLNNIKFIDFHNAWHFCTRDWFEQLPEILKNL
jgi:hypothetical protein